LFDVKSDLSGNVLEFHDLFFTREVAQECKVPEATLHGWKRKFEEEGTLPQGRKRSRPEDLNQEYQKRMKRC